jgi:2-keto-4-pentenoate hydratase/2-oxohepta-3-ene-1,7-dioic acid hydratase in catechol pathway
VPAPRRILCLGLNYGEHALEGGRAVPTWPDVIKVTVEGIGTIRNRVVAEDGAPTDWRWRPGR